MRLWQTANDHPRGVRRTAWAAGCALLALIFFCGALALTASAVGGLLVARADGFAVLPGITERVDKADAATPSEPADDEGVAPLPEQDATAGVPEGRIAFVSPRGHLGTVAPDGSNERIVSAGDEIFLFPAWSPDGQRLAAIGGDDEQAGVYTFADVADSEGHLLYQSDEQAPVYLYWAPDSRRVSFIAGTEADDGFGLYLAPADGSEESRLLATGQPFYWDWMGDGERLLIHSGSVSRDAQLAFVDVAAGAAGDNLARPGFFQAPVASADDRFVAYGEYESVSERWLVVREQDGREAVRLPHEGAIAMGWSPTGGELAFITPPEEASPRMFDYFGPLQLVDAETGVTRTLAAGTVLGFFWSPDGRSIAYLTVADVGREQNAEGAPFRQTAAAEIIPVRAAGVPVQQEHPELLFHLWLAEVEDGESRLLLTFQPVDLFLTQFLPFFDQYALSHRLWSPDSRALVLPVQEGEASRIYVIAADGSGKRAVARGNMAFWSR
ncbi:MAG: hypothetical protein R3272_10635 [Candidatus Promineifilaceae bacterium]|nr:hypothetical protein [Candidatus Promineifilaceae bacterium]